MGKRTERFWKQRVAAWNKGIRKRGGAFKITEEWTQQIAFSNCRYCRIKLEANNASLDHQLPISRGGKDESGNLILICMKCNRSKGSMTHEEFDAFLRFLSQPVFAKVRDMVLRKMRAAWRVQ